MLDSSDLKIIHLMLSNSRITLSEIAKVLHISQPAVQKRIQRLKSIGVITGSTILLNQSKIGWKHAFVVVNADRDKYQSVIASVRKLPMITAVYQTTGPYAIAIEIVGPAGVVNGVITHIEKIKGVRDYCPISFIEKVV
ncbi:HTH-type transcriptional regulator Ptr2 [Candidatus Bilamarchaeum dharawalense]|uniref:HTH-type transcriptional regulator Ptr2 n=1 Tax=Candidatus Bilamarchaeum dharawalense TaxID=2885759 RepID=A0A5E4LST2_9ARCH|nr:HTH-type transcriptional regulator Ptr2 [Candidatus Bilamarchaeum dharawalense]